MDKITHEMRLTQWAARIQDCRSSGMTIRAWCSLNDINEKQFYYWQRRVRQGVYNRMSAPPSQQQNPFVALPTAITQEHSISSTQPALVLRTNAYTLEINAMAAETLLPSILEVISRA